MAGREAPVRAHLPKQRADARRAAVPPAPTPDRRCPGAVAQLAAVHRTLRHGPLVQLQGGGAAAAPTAAAANRTGLPDRLKSGVEALSGVSLDGVKVHYNSSKPAQLNALAYAQGSDIHLAPGQEQHLPHEAWHIVQQAQGRVKPTMQMKDGVPVNDDAGLEHEADVMGERARSADPAAGAAAPAAVAQALVVQGAFGMGFEFEPHKAVMNAENPQTNLARDQGHDGQSSATRDSSDSGPALIEMVGQLEILSDQVESLGESEAVAKAQSLRPRLEDLTKIANSSDEVLKSSAVVSLRQELSLVPAPVGQIKEDIVLQKKSSQLVVQRIADIAIGIAVGAIVGLASLIGGICLWVRSRRPRTRLTLVGIDHDNQHSYATVNSEAHLTDLTQRVEYDIRWDAAVVPGGDHLGQQPNSAGGWVRDRSPPPNGQPIGDRNNDMGGFFLNSDFSGQDNAAGLHFYYPDGIRQRPLNNGTWGFRLRILSQQGAVLSSSEVVVDWNH
jgi:uncharacterized protein DUF4157